MSVNYGGPAPGGANPAPSGRASMEWINEAWRLFSAQAGTWIVSCVVAILLPLVLYFIFAMVFGMGIGMAAMSTMSSPNQGGGLGTGMATGLIVFMGLFWLAYGLLYMPFIYSGVYRMADRQIRGEPIGIGDIFSGGPTTLRMLGYQIVYGLLTFVLTLVVSIPLSLMHVVALSALFSHNSNLAGGTEMAGIFGLYFVLLLCLMAVTSLFLPAHALVADGEGVFSAMGRSMAAMKSQVLPTSGVLLLFGLLYLVSAIPCGLGLFVTIPMFWLLSALAYRDVVGMPGIASGPQFGGLQYGGSQYGVPQQPGVWPPPPGAIQPPPAYPVPPPSFGQPSLPGQPPPNPYAPPAIPPRRSLSGDDVDEQGNALPPPNRPPSASEETAP